MVYCPWWGELLQGGDGVRTTQKLAGGDIRAERARYQPAITQVELAEELAGGNEAQATTTWRAILGKVEADELELSQGEYERILAAIERVAAAREKPSA